MTFLVRSLVFLSLVFLWSSRTNQRWLLSAITAALFASYQRILAPVARQYIFNLSLLKNLIGESFSNVGAYNVSNFFPSVCPKHSAALSKCFTFLFREFGAVGLLESYWFLVQNSRTPFGVFRHVSRDVFRKSHILTCFSFLPRAFCFRGPKAGAESRVDRG